MFKNGTNGREPAVEAGAEDRIERWYLNAEDSRMVYDALTDPDRDVCNKLRKFFEEVEQLRKVLFEPPSRGCSASHPSPSTRQSLPWTTSLPPGSRMRHVIMRHRRFEALTRRQLYSLPR